MRHPPPCLPRLLIIVAVLAGTAVAGPACCKVCDTPDAGTTVPPATTAYSCQPLAADSTAAACIGGPPPGGGGPPPDPDERFPLGCNALGATATAGTTRSCTCEATAMTVDPRGSQPVWACQR